MAKMTSKFPALQEVPHNRADALFMIGNVNILALPEPKLMKPRSLCVVASTPSDTPLMSPDMFTTIPAVFIPTPITWEDLK